MSGDKQSHLEVILEDINGKFDLVLEGHVTLEHMIHEHRAETRQDKRELQALIQTSHDSLDAKINKVSNELKDTREELKDTREELKDTREELKDTREDLREEMAAGFKTLGDKVNGMDARDSALGYKVNGMDARDSALGYKVNPPGDTLLLHNSPDGIAREGALAQKVEGHEDRTSFWKGRWVDCVTMRERR